MPPQEETPLFVKSADLLAGSRRRAEDSRRDLECFLLATWAGDPPRRTILECRRACSNWPDAPTLPEPMPAVSCPLTQTGCGAASCESLRLEIARHPAWSFEATLGLETDLRPVRSALEQTVVHAIHRDSVACLMPGELNLAKPFDFRTFSHGPGQRSATCSERPRFPSPAVGWSHARACREPG